MSTLSKDDKNLLETGDVQLKVTGNPVCNFLLSQNLNNGNRNLMLMIHKAERDPTIMCLTM